MDENSNSQAEKGRTPALDTKLHTGIERTMMYCPDERDIEAEVP
jgi:hypothetical protein